MAQNVTFSINLKVDGKDVVRKVSMDMEELRNVIDEATSSSKKLSESLINFNQKAERFRTISDSVSQLAGTLNSLTEESRSFGGAMASANTMAGKSGEDFARLKDQVAELSKTIPIARDELANGLYQVISNGVPEDNWIEYLQKSAKASVGGIADLGETVKVTSTIIKNYGLEWDAAGDIQDKIQLTAKNGVTSFEQMAQALPRVTSQAANLGVGIDELMASFATLTGVSGNTAEVSTQLAAIFTALIKPSSEAAEMAQQMGIQFDAAAIKAAGGMSNFISQLDKDVKSYAQSSGMLEQEIYGKLFGSAESLRALTPLTNQLADKFQENIEAMADSTGTIDNAFDTMVNTGKAKLQILNNKLGEVSDVIQSSIGNALPYLNFSSQVLISLSSVAQLTVSLKSLGVAFNVVTIASTAANRARVSGVAISRMLQAAFRGEAVGATTAAVATRALRIAIRGLLISTGVGAAVWALTEAISYLASSSDTAEGEVSSLKEAENAAVEASARVKTEIDSEVKKLGELIRAKKDTADAVRNLNAKYGEIFGSHQKASEWYDILTQKSKTYIKQIGYEAQAKVLASKLAEKQIELENNYAKRKELWKNGGAGHTAPVVNVVDKDSGQIIGQSGGNFVESDAYKALKDEARGLIPEIGELERKLGIVEGKMKEVAKEMSSIETKGKSTLKVSQMNWSQTEKAIEETVTKMKNTTDQATISKLSAYKKQLEARQKQLKAMGVDTEKTTKKTKTEPKFYKNPKTEQELSKNINYYESKLTGQDTAEQRAIIKNIQLWKKKRQEIELAKKAALVPAELKTVQDVNAKLDYLKAKKEASGKEAQPQIDREISKTELRGLEIQRPASVSKNSTDEEIDREIAYQQKLKAVTEGSTTAIDKEIKRLERLKDKRTELQIMQDALSDVQEEFDNATTVEAKVEANTKISDLQKQIDEATKGKLTIEAETEPTYIVQGSMADKRQSYNNAQTKANRIQTDYEIGLIGREEARRQIADLNKELEGLGTGLKPIKIDVDAKGFSRAMEKIKSAWGGIQGIGSGVESITSALEGDKNAWEAVSGVVSGFIQIMEGVEAVVQIVKMLTAATQAHSTATAADSAATTANTATTTANTAASATNTAMKGGEAIANATASGAKMPFPANLIAIAAGVAAVVAALAMISGAFADGGVVGGSSPSGDKLLARVNSGEMILNAQQQARLFAIANGAAVYGAALGVGGEYAAGGRTGQDVRAQLERLQRLALEGETGATQRIRLKVRGRDLIEASGNELRSTRKRSHLR